MLHVVHGNHFETLVDQLIERLPTADPFSPTTIVVGNPLVGTWISHRYARLRGITIGMTATLLDSVITRAYCGDGDAGLTALDREQLADPHDGFSRHR